jgi:acyl-coenzyme A synthetase/AMP-(fatty) acid ligase
MEISLGEAITMTARNKPDAPSFVFADALPVNASGKILKRELRTRD